MVIEDVAGEFSEGYLRNFLSFAGLAVYLD